MKYITNNDRKNITNNDRKNITNNIDRKKYD